MGPLQYCDASASSLMPPEVINTWVRWCNQGDPAGGHPGAVEARQMVSALRAEVATRCRFALEGADAFDVYFTGGGGDSNAQILTAAVRAFTTRTGRLPHVVVSALEHASTIECCRRLVTDNMCQITVLPATGLSVTAADLKAALRPNTCIVSVISAHHDTGALVDVAPLARIARGARVPFHSDVAQLMRWSATYPHALGLDAFSASFHKFGGPPGVGLLVVRRALVEGYGLAGLLTTGDGNTPALGASLAALRGLGRDRIQRVADARAALMAAVAARVPCRYLADVGRATDPCVVWLTHRDAQKNLPGSLLLSVSAPGFDYAASQAALLRLGFIVGAVCTAGLTCMGSPDTLRGALRICLCDPLPDPAGLAAALVESFGGCLPTAAP